MAKRAPRSEPLFTEEPIPELVVDETVIVPTGQTGYRMEFDDETMEQFAKGYCPEDVSRRAHVLLEWKRRAHRVEAVEQAKAS